jgi:hypothetical protein
MTTVPITAREAARRLREQANELITNARVLHCTFSIDTKNKEQIITCYNSQTDHCTTLYLATNFHATHGKKKGKEVKDEVL